MKTFLCVVGFVAMLQQAMATFTISLDGITQTDITKLIDFPSPPSDAVTSCNTTCAPTVNAISQCQNGTNDANCYCTKALQIQMQTCEQCMFNFLVAENIKAPSPVVGSNPALAGLLGACTTANITTLDATIALGLAPNWDGPVGIHLNLGATVVVVGTGTLMGMAAIYLLFNIS